MVNTHGDLRMKNSAISNCCISAREAIKLHPFGMHAKGVQFYCLSRTYAAITYCTIFHSQVAMCVHHDCKRIKQISRPKIRLLPFEILLCHQIDITEDEKSEHTALNWIKNYVSCTCSKFFYEN